MSTNGNSAAAAASTTSRNSTRSGPARIGGHHQQQQQQQQQMEVKVSDEFVALNSVAVFKCRASGGPEFSHLIEWFTSDGLQIRVSDTSKANKFLAFRSGELHVNNVDMLDLQRTYGCRMRNAVTGQEGSSSGTAQLIVTDSLLADPSQASRASNNNNDDDDAGSGNQAAANEQQQEPKAGAFRFTPQVVHSISQLIMSEPAMAPRSTNQPSRAASHQQPPAEQEWRLLLPCAVRGPPARELRWMYQPGRASSDHEPVPLEQWAAARSLGLQHWDRGSQTGSNATATANGNRARQPRTNFLIGPTFLAIEWPGRAQSGRYTCQWVGGNGSSRARTLCDTNVIIGQPIRLRMESVLAAPEAVDQPQATGGQDYYAAAAAASSRALPVGANPREGWLGRLAGSWFGWPTRDSPALARRRRQSSETNPLLEGDPRRLQVLGPGVIEAPPMVSVGQRLQVNCRGSGHPMESVKWFRNGQAINTQSSSDFQIEITNPLFEQDPTAVGERQDDATPDLLLSSLMIRQVQAKDIGLNVFECFVHNSLGDRARAGQVVLVAERGQLEWARSVCPVGVANAGNGSSYWSVDGDETDQLAEVYPADEGVFGWSPGRPGSLFKRLNPLRRALVLESEPVELRCPLGAVSGRRLEWRRLPVAGDLATASASKQQTDSRSLNQLFGGDSRFVINGSSLQIRSPSKRHDEALYVCRPPTGSQPDPSPGSGSSSGLAGPTYQEGAESRRPPAGAIQLHQSSLAPPSAASAAACDSLLDSALSGWQPNQALVGGSAASGSGGGGGGSANGSPAGYSPMSSISIRIVGRPKIDPFEFSRNLEEGMRAVLVCAVISGQSPIDITWFKDGDFLLADEQISIDQTNGFSSTLTFHRIQPSHMGLYTCVAANAFASTNHTSRLVVNVAPYFIDPPQNTRAVLGSNVLVNCQAGGQPSPQIRWRKLVSIGSSPPKQVAPPSGQLMKLGEFTNADLDPSSLLTNDLIGSQVSGPRQEFRIVTSNSHIQILENGSMIIKEVELGDASRYVCQAFNGIQPSLSEVIELNVLSPAQFDVHYETVSVKRDSMIKFNCVPRGDQPMQIEWHKESFQLLPASQVAAELAGQTTSKYNEIAHLFGPGERQRHTSLVIQQQVVGSPAGSHPKKVAATSGATQEGLKMSELLIGYADRTDTGTFVCLARNAYGKDELTYRLVVQEPPDVPTSVQAQAVLATTLRLLWLAPFDGNLALSHFVIEYRKLHQNKPSVDQQQQQQVINELGAERHNEWTRLVVSTGQLDDASSSGSSKSISGQAKNSPGQFSINLRQLQPKSTYHIRVAAVNGLGQSAFSVPLAVVTAEEPPTSRPDDLRAQPVSSGSIRVLWRGPALVDEQAPVKGYYVSHRKLSSTSQQQQVGAQDQLWLATGSIQASNTTAASPTGTGSYRAPDQEAKQFQMGAGYEYLLNGLDKNTKYEVRVQPYNSMGTGPPSDTIGQTLKFDRPGQPHLKLVASRRQSFELKWSLSDDQPLMGFSLFYKCEYDDWQEIQLGIIYHYVIENLRCGNKYQIYLSAYNVVGRSDPSDVLSVRTEGTVPVAPDKAQFVRSNITEAQLDMGGWQSGGCPISSFMIQFKRLHDSNWFILSEGPTPFAMSDKITIPDLVPGTWYKLLVTALNEAGSTNAEYLFSTLTTSGKPLAPPNFPLESKEGTSGWLADSESGGGGGGMFSGLSQLFGGSGQQQHPDQGQLLLPASCILLLLVTMLASYLYYSRSTSHSTPASEQRKLTARSTSGAQMIDQQQQHLQQCRSAGNTLQREEKQLIQSDHQLHYQLMNAQSLPLDASVAQQMVNFDTIQRQRLNNPSDQMFDSLVNHATLQSLMTNASRTSGQDHGMRLLPTSGNMFSGGGGGGSSAGSGAALGGNCTNSSLSTQSTNCQFDCGASSSQASSSGTSGCGGLSAKAKLQLIDESSLMVEPAREEPLDYNNNNNNQGQQFLYAGQQQQQPTATYVMASPVRQQIYNPAASGPANHVDLIAEPMETNNNNNQSMVDSNNLASHLFMANNNQQYQDQCNNNQCYGRRLVTTSSFASAADLLQRQQKLYQQQQQKSMVANEPIYQRLDSFPMAMTMSKQQQQQFAAIVAQAKSAQSGNVGSSMDDFHLRSMTMNTRTMQQQQQQQPFQLSDSDNQFAGGVFMPANHLSGNASNNAESH